MFDLKVPFFVPLWRRILTVAVALGWAALEFISGSVGWAILFGAAGAYAAHQFFIAWDPKGKDE